MQKQTHVDLSIIILSYNTISLLRRCLASIFTSQMSDDAWEIIVVDNASIDGSADMVARDFPSVRVIKNRKNIGFAAGNNIGIRSSHGSYVLLLNSDAEVRPGTLRTMLDFLVSYPDAGAATCRLELVDGSLDPACHRGFPTPWAAMTYFLGFERLFPRVPLFSQYHAWYKDLSSVHEIDSPSGAFFLVRRSVIDEVGLLDEDFFMYGEDIDWAYRIKEAGRKILYNPSVSALHRKKQSGLDQADSLLQKQTEKHFYDTMRLFYQKHYAHRYGWAVTALVLWGIKIRSLL
ncbi:glycosyltransferase family 2 protein [Candidatus Gottesmanbacteria bacterium]|nr:glycosyltransferase family 2 protein [Candidatus Gottesmanbacteria bacterium]